MFAFLFLTHFTLYDKSDAFSPNQIWYHVPWPLGPL